MVFPKRVPFFFPGSLNEGSSMGMPFASRFAILQATHIQSATTFMQDCHRILSYRFMQGLSCETNVLRFYANLCELRELYARSFSNVMFSHDVSLNKFLRGCRCNCPCIISWFLSKPHPKTGCEQDPRLSQLKYWARSSEQKLCFWSGSLPTSRVSLRMPAS